MILCSEDAEESVIGSVLVDPGCFPTLALQATDFYLRRLREVWAAFERLQSVGTVIDFVTVTEELQRVNQLEPIGGAAYLAKIVGRVPSSLHVDEYAGIVRDYSQRRHLRTVAERLAKIATDQKTPVDGQLGDVVASLTDRARAEHGVVHVSEYTHRLQDEVLRMAENPQGYAGMPTGFKDFDAATGGLHGGDLMYLSGDPGVGKSMFAMQGAFQLANNGFPGAVYSLEMPGVSVLRRRVSHMEKIPSRNMRQGLMTDENWIGFNEAISAINDLPLYLSDSSSWTTASLRADLARAKAQYGIQWFVLDYVLLLSDTAENEIERTSHISRNLKSICRMLDIAGIAIVSENKSGMDDGDQKQVKFKSGKALRGSGQQFYDADLLLFLSADTAQPNQLVCQFGKGREMEEAKKVFFLIRKPGFPGLENATTKFYSGNDVQQKIGYPDYTR